MSGRVELRLGSELPGREALVARFGDRFEAASAAELVARVPDAARLHVESATEDGGLCGCLACGHSELFTRKDFPRGLGLAIVVVAAVLAPFTYYASLGLAALLDLVLYKTSGNVVQCYVCASEHRGFPDWPHHPAFDREIDERLKFGPKAVMGRPMREGGTAGAPEPEH